MQNVDLELRLVRKTCVVVCPTAKLPAEVKLEASLRLESCSRWSESGDCAQTCAPQIRFSSESLEEFVAIYGGRRCACCGAVLTATDWYDNRLGPLRCAGEEPNSSRGLLTTSITMRSGRSGRRGATSAGLTDSPAPGADTGTECTCAARVALRRRTNPDLVDARATGQMA